MSGALKSLPPTPRVSAEEFLSWGEDPQGLRWELIDGEPVCMAPPSWQHAAVHAELVGLIGTSLRAATSPCRALVGPGVQPREQGDWNVRIPDVAIECVPPTDRQTVRNPVLVAEILSPGNERKTRSNVWAYMSIPSVREILLLYGWRCEGELLRRQPDNSWPERPEPLKIASTLTLETAHLAVPFREVYVTSGLLEVTPLG